MTIEEALKWYNVLFYVSILLGVVFVLASTLGIGAGGDLDVDADADVDVDADVDADVEASAFAKVLSLFGIGRCPLSIVMFSALLIFGGTGVILNWFFAPYLVIVSIVGAFVAMLFLTRLLATTVSRLMPNTETYNIEPEHFIGVSGLVVLTVDEKFGQIHVRDHHGSLHKLNARAYKGSSHPKGKRVFVVEHKAGVFYVDNNPQEIE